MVFILFSRLKKSQEAYATKNIPLDLGLVAQNKSEESSGTKPLNKKQQKVATAAKKEAAKAAFVAKKALQSDTTLDRLLNETIPEGEDASDESFAPDESVENESEDSDDEATVEPEVPSPKQKKRNNEEAFPEVDLKKSKSKQPQSKKVKPTKPEPKVKLAKKQKLESSLDSSANTSSTSAPSSPDTPKPKKTKKQLVLAPVSSPDSPVVVKSKKIANAGIQKRQPKPSATSDKNAKKTKKSAIYSEAAKEDLEKIYHKVSAADIKKKTKATRR